MKKPPKAAPAQKQGLAAMFALELRGKVIAGIIGIVAAGILAGLTGFLPDYGALEPQRSVEVIYGDTVRIDPSIEPRWWPLHRARFMTVGYDRFLARRPGTDVDFPLPLVKERLTLSQIQKALMFDVREPGPATANLMLRLVAKSGRVIAEAPMAISIVPHAKYDGRWKATLGARTGVLTLSVLPGTNHDGEIVDVYGVFQPDDHSPVGLVAGKFDGDQFVGQMTFGDMPTRVLFTAKTARTGQDLTANGTAETRAAVDGDWRLIAGSQAPFRISRAGNS